jgi:hypothetical protein
MRDSNGAQSGLCFLAAVVQLLVFSSIFSWADQSRERWPILIALTFGMCAAFGGGIGALFNRMWAGVLVGCLLPVAIVLIYGFPC